MFGQNAMAPVANTPNDLHTARSIRRPRVKPVVGIICRFSAQVRAMETLLKPAANAMP